MGEIIFDSVIFSQQSSVPERRQSSPDRHPRQAHQAAPPGLVSVAQWTAWVRVPSSSNSITRIIIRGGIIPFFIIYSHIILRIQKRIYIFFIFRSRLETSNK